MPLHDWTERSGWDGVHLLWITELLRWIKPRLPTGYRAYVGTVPTIAVGAPAERPDVSVRCWPEESTPDAAPPANGPPSGEAPEQPDEEIATAILEASPALFVECRGQLVAAVELVSPRNKDHLSTRATHLSRYVGYLLQAVHLLLVDVHRRPLNFSFADRIAEEMEIRQPPCPPPMAVAYRVGERAATGGRFLAIWRRPLPVDGTMPRVVLPITVDFSVSVDLEQTYTNAAADAYLT
jgi:hypothetical protein